MITEKEVIEDITRTLRLWGMETILINEKEVKMYVDFCRQNNQPNGSIARDHNYYLSFLDNPGDYLIDFLHLMTDSETDQWNKMGQNRIDDDTYDPDIGGFQACLARRGLTIEEYRIILHDRRAIYLKLNDPFSEYIEQLLEDNNIK